MASWSAFPIAVVIFLLTSLQVWGFASSELAVPFFRTPDSQFASGEKNRLDLEKRKIREQSEFRYLVEVSGKKRKIDGRSVARDLHLAQQVYHPKLQKSYPVISVEGSRVWVQDLAAKSKDSFPINELTPVVEDLGAALTLTGTNLRSEPDWKSNSILTIPAKTRLKILEIQEDWLKVEFESMSRISGFIDSQNVLLKLDFASFAWDGKKWLPISHREGTEIVLKDRKHAKLSDIRAIITRPELAIVSDSANQEGLPLRQHLLIQQTENNKWNLSQLKGHGIVFWKSSKPELTRMEMDFKNTLNTDQILKLEITSVSFHPKNPSIGLVSAGGIYYTNDGWVWRKLEQFGNQNLPVLISERGEWFVGTQRSFNSGRSFQPYLHVDKLTLAVQQYLGSSLRDLRITDLSDIGKQKIKIELNTGGHKLSASALIGQSPMTYWDFSTK